MRPWRLVVILTLCAGCWKPHSVLLGSALTAEEADERLIGWQGETFNSLANENDVDDVNVNDVSGGDDAKVSSSVHDIDTSEPWVETVSWAPRAFVYHNFLSMAECDHLVMLGQQRVQKSMVVDSVTGKTKYDDIRTSFGAAFKRGEDQIIAGIEEKIAEWTHIPPEHGEQIQILRYENGQKYDAHWDWFGKAIGETHFGDKGDRLATVLMYLAEVAEGGETTMPLATAIDEQLQKLPNPSKCAINSGVSVQPRKGDALMFFDLDVAGANGDHKALHASCPTLKIDGYELWVILGFKEASPIKDCSKGTQGGVRDTLAAFLAFPPDNITSACTDLSLPSTRRQLSGDLSLPSNRRQLSGDLSFSFMHRQLSGGVVSPGSAQQQGPGSVGSRTLLQTLDPVCPVVIQMNLIFELGPQINVEAFQAEVVKAAAVMSGVCLNTPAMSSFTTITFTSSTPESDVSGCKAWAEQAAAELASALNVTVASHDCALVQYPSALFPPVMLLAILFPPAPPTAQNGGSAGFPLWIIGLIAGLLLLLLLLCCCWWWFCVVAKGMKWTATKWIHNKPYMGKYAALEEAGSCVDYPGTDCAAKAADGGCERNAAELKGAGGVCRKTCNDCAVCAKNDVACYRRNALGLSAKQ